MLRIVQSTNKIDGNSCACGGYTHFLFNRIDYRRSPGTLLVDGYVGEVYDVPVDFCSPVKRGINVSDRFLGSALDSVHIEGTNGSLPDQDFFLQFSIWSENRNLCSNCYKYRTYAKAMGTDGFLSSLIK